VISARGRAETTPEEQREGVAVLVVDDDRLVLANVCDGLAEAGFAVLRAASGEEAVRVCLELDPDIVVMDVRMPGMSGTEAARQIRAQTDVPVLFFSAYDTETEVREAVAEGALGYLVKPVRLGQLVAAIKTALARAGDLARLREQEENLQLALRANRAVSMAIGLLMERHRFSQAAAFEVLRARARAARRKVAEYAADLVAAAEKLNLPEG
jgi:response regulator NasT